MKCQQNDKLIKDTNIYPGFYCYILVLKCKFDFYTSTISTKRLPNVFFFPRRDLKPENILLDDRGMLQCFFLIVQFRPEWANMWAHFLAREYYLFSAVLLM